MLRRTYYLILCLLLGCLSIGNLSAQVVLNEVRYQGQDIIELRNTGSTTVDISNWWLCANFSYVQLNDPSLSMSGSLNILPGDIASFWNFSLDDSASDLGLYNSNQFASSTAMEDFVQWGAGGLGREAIAVSKGIWTAGDYVATLPSAAYSMEYRGFGDSSADWFAASPSTFGAMNSISACHAGFVESQTWEDTMFYCKGPGGTNGLGAFQMFAIGQSMNPYAYVITDTQGNILGLPPGDMVDFTQAPPGECWIYGVSYTGSFQAMVGQNLFSTALSDSCFALSNNRVVVIRDTVDGGTVQSSSGMDTLQVCYNDPNATTVYSFDSTTVGSGSFTYLVTDAAGNILGIPPGDMVDFAGAGPGECWVWGVSYTGTFTAQVGDNINQVALCDGCFDLSDNFIVVLRDDVDGGMVQSELGADTLTVCYNDPNQSTVFAFDSTGTAGPNFTYVVTDAAGTILGVPPADMVNFAGAGPGECWVWGLSYSGNLTASIGDNAAQVALSDGCFDLSDNFIVVLREDVDGGMVQSELGADTLTVCYNDPNQSTVFAFDSTGTAGPNFTYVVTDAAGTILGVPPADMVNFAGAGPGECWVWGLSYSGNLTASIGDNATQVALSDGCFDLSDNFIVVLREDVDGGMVQSELGADTLTVCYNDPNQSAVFAFDSTGTAGPNFTYVVTDAAGTILGVPPADMVNFAGAGPGECWVWGLSYSGNLTASIGDNATQVALSDGCFDLSDNFIVVLREDVDGGMVQSELGADTLTVCYNDPNQSTVFAFDSTGTVGPNFTYVVTDAAGTILGVPPADMVNFAGAGPGECWVWGLSYSGNLTASIGDNAAQVALSDGCFDLSDNFIVVLREDVDGGMVQSELGPDTLSVCYNDPNLPTVFAFDSTGTVGANFAYVVTDAAGNILGLPPGDMVDFAGAGPGECWVWGLSYTGNLTASIGDNATQVALSDGCFDLSDNFIVVLREDVDGGAVKSESGGPQDLYVCYNDPNAPTVFAFDSLGTSGPNYAYVVTDTAGTILGLPPGDMVDFAGAGPGECWVWGLSYTGTVTASVGDNALQVALASGCFDLSDNFIRVIRDDVDGGAVKSESAGPQDLYVCYNDPNAPTVFAFDSLGNVGPNYAYVVTDTAGTILGLPPGDMVDFAGAGPGECWVWGLSYTGTVTASVGDNALQVALSSGCFDLSDNFIRVIRDDVDGGMVQEANGMDTVLVCYAGGTPTTFSFDSTNTLGANFTYVVTNPNGVILGVPPGDMVDFSGAGPGECWVWGLSYTGTLTAQVGDTATQIALSSGCYDLSDNFVVALRDSTGTPCGTMLTGGGSTTLSLFPNPTQQDLILRLPVVSDTDRSAVIEIVSLEGKVLYRESMTRNPDVVEDKRIDVSLFAQGLYIVRVISPTQVLQQKFSKR